MTDLLSAAFENLKAALFECARLRKIANTGQMNALENLEAERLALRALDAYYKAERQFNHQLSLAIRESGEVPLIAQEALSFQRLHGFHGRGTAKIISVHSQR